MRTSFYYLGMLFCLFLTNGQAAAIRCFSENKAFCLEVAEKGAGTIELRSFQARDPSKLMWALSLPVSDIELFSTIAVLSNNGEVAVLEPDYRDKADQTTLKRADMLIFRNGQLIQTHNGSDMASVLSDNKTTFPKDLFEKLHSTGALRDFDGANNRLRVWMAVVDHWFALDLVTGNVIKASKQEEVMWNSRMREKCLLVLTNICDGDPAKLGGRARKFDEKLFSFGKFSRSEEAIIPYAIRDMVRFLTRRHVSGDDVWIKSLLNTPLDDSYSSGPVSIDGRTEIDPAPVRFGGHSDLRDLGDMLLRQWADGLESYSERSYARDYGYLHLATVNGLIHLPQIPTTNDGFLRLTLNPIPQKGTSPPPEELSWRMDDAVSWAAKKMPWESNLLVHAVANRVELSLEGVRPGKYLVNTLWARSRGTNQVALPGDYFEAERALTVMVGEKADLEIFCTNRLKGFEDAYPTNQMSVSIPRLRRHATYAERREAVLRKARRSGGLLAERSFTNLTLGSLRVRKMTYGTYHKFLQEEETTEKNVLVVWFDQPPRGEVSLFDIEVASGGSEFSSGGSAEWERTSSDAPSIIAKVVDFWPRAEKTLRLRLKDREGRKKGEVTLPNIAMQRAAELKVDSLPATKSIEDLQVTFEGVSQFGPTVSVRRGKNVAGDWEVRLRTFEDAVGNQSSNLEDFVNEKAVRCRFELVRSLAGRFTKEEEWWVPVMVPNQGEFSILTNSGSRQDVEIRLVALGGVGEIEYQNFAPRGGKPTVDSSAEPFWNGSHRPLGKPDVFIRGTGHDFGFVDAARSFSIVGVKPHLTLEIEGMTADHRVFVNGHTLEGENSGLDPRTRRGDLRFLALSENPGPATIRIVVQKKREIEFVIKVPASRRLRRTFDALRAPFERTH